MVKLFILFSFIGSLAHANSSMSQFLKSCAYGTAGGAVLGLASLSVSDNPGGKMNNIARGASLGLYAGIAYGFYSLEKNKEQNLNNRPADFDVQNFLYLSPVATRSHVNGVQLNWFSRSF